MRSLGQRKTPLERSKDSDKNSMILLPVGSYPCKVEDFGEFTAEGNPGPAEFNALIGQMSSTRNKWVYCTELNKLYIVWHQVIPVEFRWIPVEEDLVVRALPIYTDPENMNEPVTRCLIHMDPLDPENDGFDWLRHVVRSDNPGVVYDENAVTKRCSVVVPLGRPQPGTGTVTVTYKFVCKTSCATGMNRRPISLVFTLEKRNGMILGRQSVGVKICSCPRRDLEKELLLLYKKVKNEKKSDESRHCLSLCLPNIYHFIKVLEFNHGGVTSLLRSIPQTDPRFTELSEIQTALEEKFFNVEDLVPLILQKNNTHLLGGQYRETHEQEKGKFSS